MMKLEEYYLKCCRMPSDINEHLPRLRFLAEGCDHVTEFGTRIGVSTTALLAAQPPKLVTYDIDECKRARQVLLPLAGKTDLVFIQQDTLQANIEDTDMLLFDTLHFYGHLKAEIDRHADKVQKYLVFHDTMTYGVHGRDEDMIGSPLRHQRSERGRTGIWDAITESISGWRWHSVTSYNNGLAVLCR